MRRRYNYIQDVFGNLPADHLLFASVIHTILAKFINIEVGSAKLAETLEIYFNLEIIGVSFVL
jgi:hypothetical protein